MPNILPIIEKVLDIIGKAEELIPTPTPTTSVETNEEDLDRAKQDQERIDTASDEYASKTDSD